MRVAIFDALANHFWLPQTPTHVVDMFGQSRVLESNNFLPPVPRQNDTMPQGRDFSEDDSFLQPLILLRFKAARI